MSVKLDVKCTTHSGCKFNDRCVLIRPIKVLDPSDAGGDFHPIFKIRMIRNELQIRCFSFADKGGING